MGFFKKFISFLLYPKPSVLISFEEIIGISEILYPKDAEEFKKLATLYQSDIQKFENTHSAFAKEHGLDLKKVDYINLLCSFGDSKNFVELIDWRGEENEGEIEDFISNLSSKKHDWLKTHQFRNENSSLNQNEGYFILNLFKILAISLRLHKDTSPKI